MALLDILKGRKQQTTNVVPTQASDIQRLQQIKATGKEVGPSAGPAISNIQSQAAAQQAQADQGLVQAQATAAGQALGQQQQVQAKHDQLVESSQRQQLAQAQQAITDTTVQADQQRQAREEMASAALRGQEARFTQQITSTYADSLKDLASARGIAEQDIFSNVKQMQAKLGVEKTEAYLEQAAHRAAMADRAYVDNILSIGKMRDLEDQLNFRREAMQTAFGRDMDILGRQFDMKSLMMKDEREFRSNLANMDINTAIDLAKQAAKEENYKQGIKGTVDTTSAVSNYYSGGGKAASSTTDHSSYDQPNNPNESVFD